MQTVVVISGAGISAESGIKTFRDGDGLWENHDIMEVASFDGWERNPGLILDFYNKRRAQASACLPNKAHQILADLEKDYHLEIITQNVDDLHERAGSKNVLHLHGELLKSRSTLQNELIYHCSHDIHIGDLCELGSQLRPHIVWFGEEVPLIDPAIQLVKSADIILVIGTSLLVYPAAGLINYASKNAKKFIIDPQIPKHVSMDFIKIEAGAIQGIQTFKNSLYGQA
jgi:NAD-dependent deacetylase